jgi:glycine/D-amino acid oxidase-like deaminating enzyme
MATYDFLIIGAGIFGITTAVALRQKGYQVGILNPDSIPHPLAASTDISKIVRMEYGSDTLYMKMADQSIDGWKEWNAQFETTLYHEVGFLLLCKKNMEDPSQVFEKASYDNLIQAGYQPQRLDEASIPKRYPAIRPGEFVDGFFHPKAGFAESGRAVAVLTEHARQLGVDIIEQQTAEKLIKEAGTIKGVHTREGKHYTSGHTIVCAGAHTPYLIPELLPYMKVTGHPVFHLQPNQPDLLAMPDFPVFAADISNTGWYGFPTHPTEKVIKIANHGKGLELHPENDERKVLPDDHEKLNQFLERTFPSLVGRKITYTRRCVYTDTLDGHFWIDQHPALNGLTIGTGGSGHGYKMGPVLGKLIAAAALGEPHPWLERFRWRELSDDTLNVEEARGK